MATKGVERGPSKMMDNITVNCHYSGKSMRESEQIDTIFPTGELAIAVTFVASPLVAEFLTLWRTLNIDTV